MNPTDSPTPASRLAQRRLRVRSIRRRVAGLAAGTFLAATGWIFVQLVSGHDPALAHGGSPVTSKPAAHTAARSTSSTAAPSPVTTGAS